VQIQTLDKFQRMAARLQAAVPEVPERLPEIRFWRKIGGEFDPKTWTISLPTPEMVASWHHGHGEVGECDGGALEQAFVHELAHWGTNGEGHTARMYGFLYAISKLFGYPVMKVREYELTYKPRAAKMGWRVYLRTFRDDEDPSRGRGRASSTNGVGTFGGQG
jgi:hypothetical protein